MAPDQWRRSACLGLGGWGERSGPNLPEPSQSLSAPPKVFLSVDPQGAWCGWLPARHLHARTAQFGSRRHDREPARQRAWSTTRQARRYASKLLVDRVSASVRREGYRLVLEDAARARAMEANCLASHGHLCGAIYLAGYVVECKLKILLNKMGKPFPRSGQAGHDLKGLWQAAGLRYEDITGLQRAFLDYWSTGTRYSATVESDHVAHDLLDAAQALAGYVTRRITYTQGPRRGGKKV